MIRGIVFDKDGTLFDFERTWAAWAAALLDGLFGDDADEVAHTLGFDRGAGRFRPGSPVIAETTAHLAQLLLPRLPGWSRARLVGHMKDLAQSVTLVPTVPLRPLLKGLAGEGLALGLATNDDEATARAHLAQAGVDDLFGFVAGYDSGFGGKPEAGQMRAFLDWSGLSAGMTAMVGDSLHDLHAGRAAGMRTIAVLTGPAVAADLAAAADVVLPDIGHLPAWLSGL
jgi:phosphoglycolate phosphatase